MSPPYVYQNLANFTEYQNFQYKFDFLTIITSISFIFLIPSIICTLKMVIFYLNHPKITVTSHNIHPYVFKSFITMQSWNICNTIIDFLTTRIPVTTAFTSFCVLLEPMSFYRFIVAGVYFSFDNAQFFTVLFCAMRVLILYTLVNQEKLCRRLFIVCSVITYGLSLADSLPVVFYDVLCLQMNSPFKDGAVVFSSLFMFGNNLMNMMHFAFSTAIILLILIATGLVILKLRSEEIRKATSRSLNRSRAETTLTVTTILIIIPLFLAQGLTIASLAKSPLYSYILSIRPLFLDLRVNLVSIYFYLTHPMFKKKSTVSSTLVKSLGSTQ